LTAAGSDLANDIVVEREDTGNVDVDVVQVDSSD
jgi:hypothetical protein